MPLKKNPPKQNSHKELSYIKMANRKYHHKKCASYKRLALVLQSCVSLPDCPVEVTQETP